MLPADNPERLLTTAEVAALLGVTPSTITAYKRRGQMPPPDQQYGRTPLWRWATIMEWQTGRPRPRREIV